MDLNKYKNYKCPCCGYYTLGVKADNTFQICPVCYWQDDGIQLNNPLYEGGANSVNLITARENFKKFGASEEVFLSEVRNPKEDEL